MVARAAFAFVALALVYARAQPHSIWVDVAPNPDDAETEESEELEKRYTPELVEDLDATKAETLLLYTEFQARASQSLKQFIRNISKIEYETRLGLEPGLLEQAPESCRVQFENRLKKITYNTHRAAVFSGENHHKFFLGHMIVFRMHLNKSEEYIKRSEKVVSTCGILCETQPKIRRWRRLALTELNRVRDDLQHSRAMYRDLLTHAQRRLNTLRRRANSDVAAARDGLRTCVANGG